jgi:hypothetical protein
VSNERIFQIERFYFGNLIQDGQPVGKPMVVAHSPGITAPIAQHCLRLMRVRPPDLNLTRPDMPSTLAMLRGGELGYVMVKSQRTAEGYPQLMYIIIPDMAMRWLGGNYRLFESLGYQDMRTFEQPRRDLPTLSLEDPTPLPDDEQINLLYDLFYYCNDQVKTVEGLLAALIHNHPIAILNAPLSLQKRLGFIQGLLSLLPAPARVAMTWASHADSTATMPTQINFVSTPDQPKNACLYDLEQGQLLSAPVSDKYSKFIASQLRLDASLVVETTQNIARTAVWRAMRKDSLPQALLFASRRAAIDSAVSTNQPADREMVASILRQDPTLEGRLRIQYAKHLLAFTLALGDEFHHADVLPVVAAADRPVAEAVFLQLREAAKSPKNSLNIIGLVERWLVNVPQASVIPWQQLAYEASITYLDSILSEGKSSKAVDFLQRIQGANRALRMENVVPQLLDISWGAAAYDRDLALAVFLLSAEYLSIETFLGVVGDAHLVGQLPGRLRQALYYLQRERRPNPPPNVLVSVVSELEAQHRMLVLGRLAELAVYLKREELIDTRILEGLLRASQSGYAWRFAGLLQHLANRYSQPDKLRELDQASLELLPHLYFSMQRYETGLQLLEHYQNTLFGPTRLAEFTDMLGNIFQGSTLPIDALEKVFALIEHSKLRPEPRTRAYATVLQAVNWGQAYRNLARRLSVMLFNDEKLVDVIGIEPVLQLLTFFTQAKDASSVQEASDILLAHALQQNVRGLELVMKTYQLLGDSPELPKAGLNLLRRYVRLADPEFADKLPSYFEKRLGAEVGSALRATFAMRRLLGGRSLLQFTDSLDYATAFLVDAGTAYHESKEPPHRTRIKDGLDSMSGGLTDAERDRIGQNLTHIAQHIFAIGTRQERGQAAGDFERALLRNDAMPRTALDFLIFLGGIFGQRKRVEVDLARQSRTHVLGNRSAVMLRDETTVISAFLGDLLAAFPQDQHPDFDLDSLNEEIDHLWQQLSLYQQRQVQDSLAVQTQYLAQVITALTRHSKGAAFSNRKLVTGQVAPSNAIEALLWISGYFNRTHDY